MSLEPKETIKKVEQVKLEGNTSDIENKHQEKSINSKGWFNQYTPVIIHPSAGENKVTSESKKTEADIFLKQYKNLQKTENGFKILKDKEMLMSRFFLKKEERIEATMYIMVLSLLVYCYLEQKIKLLEESENLKAVIISKCNFKLEGGIFTYFMV